MTASQKKRYKGVVASFDDDKGFGFIQCRQLRQDVFLHATASAGSVRPAPGHRVTFAVETEERGLRAVNVRIVGRGLAPSRVVTIGMILLLIALMIGLKLLTGIAWIWAYLIGISVITLGFWGSDKHRALRPGLRRIPESVLLGLCGAGGSPGGLIGIVALRHKTRKGKFLFIFAAIAAVQVLALLLWLRSTYSAA